MKTTAKDIEYQKLLADAVRLRLAKVPYTEIIEKLGHWNSVQACQKAVAAHLRKNQKMAVEDSRAEAVAILNDQLTIMRAKFERSKSRFDSAEIRKILREINLLEGNYAPTKVAETDIKGKDKSKIVMYLPNNMRD